MSLTYGRDFSSADPEEGEQGILCSRAGSPWSQFVTYGGLVVFYKAKDQSEKSPRSLATWVFPVDDQLPAPLAVQDDVPLNLTFNQLKAKYPAGKLEDPDYGGRMFTLPNQLWFIANPSVSKPGLVGAGPGGPC